jgi:hypothetical protein
LMRPRGRGAEGRRPLRWIARRAAMAILGQTENGGGTPLRAIRRGVALEVDLIEKVDRLFRAGHAPIF